MAGRTLRDRSRRRRCRRCCKQIVDDRLGRLGDETAALLAIAAVVGQEVPLAVWGAVARADEETLLAAAERAEAAHLVTASARGDGIRFTHALIRDVLYEDVPALRRRRIHRQVAEALIALPVAGPGRGGLPPPAGGGRARGRVAGAGGRAGRGCLRAGDGGRALRGRDRRCWMRKRRIPPSAGWLRLLAAALRRHDDRDRAFAWAEEAVRLARHGGGSQPRRPRAGVAGAAAWLSWRLSHRRGDHLPPRRIWSTGCRRGPAPPAAASNRSTRSPTAAR